MVGTFTTSAQTVINVVRAVACSFLLTCAVRRRQRRRPSQFSAELAWRWRRLGWSKRSGHVIVSGLWRQRRRVRPTSHTCALTLQLHILVSRQRAVRSRLPRRRRCVDGDRLCRANYAGGGGGGADSTPPYNGPGGNAGPYKADGTSTGVRAFHVNVTDCAQTNGGVTTGGSGSDGGRSPGQGGTTTPTGGSGGAGGTNLANTGTEPMVRFS